MYPHSTDCWALLVPYVKSRENFLKSLVRQPIVWLFTCTLLLMMVVRMLCHRDDVGAAIQLTFGAFFAQINLPYPQSPANYIWTITTLMCAIFASIVLSGSIYAIIVNVKYEPEIDTFEQLLRSNLLIYAISEGADGYYEFKE